MKEENLAVCIQIMTVMHLRAWANIFCNYAVLHISVIVTWTGFGLIVVDTIVSKQMITLTLLIINIIS